MVYLVVLLAFLVPASQHSLQLSHRQIKRLLVQGSQCALFVILIVIPVCYARRHRRPIGVPIHVSTTDARQGLVGRLLPHHVLLPQPLPLQDIALSSGDVQGATGVELAVAGSIEPRGQTTWAEHKAERPRSLADVWRDEVRAPSNAFL